MVGKYANWWNIAITAVRYRNGWNGLMMDERRQTHAARKMALSAAYAPSDEEAIDRMVRCLEDQERDLRRKQNDFVVNPDDGCLV